MPNKSKKITYASAATALAVLFMLFSQLTTLKAPLLICSVCFYLALKKSGIITGSLAIIASILIILLMSFWQTALLVTVVFAPYAFVAFFMRNLSYKKPASMAIRVFVLIAFSSILLLACYHLANIILPSIDFDSLISRFGGYVVFVVLVWVFALVMDFIFGQLCLNLDRLIK